MNTILCPSCDHANVPNSKFCSNCGHRLPPSTEIICPNCQTPNPRNLFYCDHCGARLVKETLPTEVESDPDLDDELEPASVHPTDLFALPTRKPGDTGKLDRNTLPDWLRTAGLEEDEEDIEAETSSAPSAIEGEPPPRGATEELPDWLVTDSSVELYQPPSEISTEAYLEMTEDEPPELSDTPGVNEDLNLPDWLTDAVRETGSLTEKRPTQPQLDEPDELPNPFETSTSIPEWLAEVGGITRQADTIPAEEEEDEEIPTVADWSFSQSAYDEAPDWLLEGDDETVEPTVVPEVDADLSGLREWGKAIHSANLPEWYSELDRPGSEKLNNWLAQLDDLEEPEFIVDEPDASSVADRLNEWLSESEEPAVQASNDRIATGMLTGWLSELDGDDETDAQEDDEGAEDRIVTGMLTGWLTELDEDEPEISEEIVEADEFEQEQSVDWLAETEADDFEIPAESQATSQPASWLKDNEESDEFDFLGEAEEEQPESDELTGWLLEPEEGDSNFLTESTDIDQFTSEPVDNDESSEFDLLDELESDQFDSWLTEAEEGEFAHLPQLPDTDQMTSGLPSGAADDKSDFLTESSDTTLSTDWLMEEDGEDESLLIDEAAPETRDATGMLTGWLAELDGEDEVDFPDEDSEERAVTGMLTGWLTELEEEPEEEVVAGTLTGWLTELDEDEASGSLDDAALVDEAEPDTVMEWLDESEKSAWIDDEPEDEETTASDNITDWLADIESHLDDEAESEEVGMPDDVDNWLADVEVAGQDGDDESSDLYAELPLPAASDEAEPALDSLAEAEVAEELPDWLTDLGEAESQDNDQQSELVQEDLPDWLSNMKPSENVQGSSIPGLGLDVDLTDDFAEIPPELSGADLPDWLHVPTSPKQKDGDSASTGYGADVLDWLQPDDDDQIQQQDSSGQLRSILSELPPPRDPRENLVKADIPEWVDALKPKSLKGEQSPQPVGPAPESGPLLGVPGVIEIAPVIAASPVAHKTPVSQLTVTPEQQQQAEMLQQLAQEDMLLSETAVSPRRRLAWGRVLLYLILLAFISAPIILDTRLSLVRENTVPAPSSIEIAQAAITAAAGQSVLVAFDYTPALEGELATEADALMEQLTVNNSQVIPVSQSAAGTAIAATYTDQPALFVPGEAVGLRQMGVCLADGCEMLFGRSLENDLSQVALIIVLTGDRKSLVNWIEQVGSQTNVPVLAATTQSLEPLALSYVTSKQLDGLLSHLAALGRYEETLPAAPANIAAQRTLNAQLLVQLLLIVLLLFGLIGQLRRTAMSRNR